MPNCLAIYLPVQPVAGTPVGDLLRVAGMMEFCSPDARCDLRRVTAIVAAARPFLRTADLDTRMDERVGERPCTSDGLALIGRTASPRIQFAGGHGMWGITRGPIAGKLLAQQIVNGSPVPALRAFDPLH